MKKLIIWFSCLLAFIFIVHLFTDDQLNPQAQEWLDYYFKEPNLEQNAYIELIALGIDNESSYDIAKNKYLDSVSQIEKGFLDYDKQLKYPLIIGLPEIFDDPKYCSLDEDGCFQQLQENQKLILSDISIIKDKLQKFRKIATYDNFDFINSISTEPTFDMSVFYRLSGIQAYYLINDGDMNQAASIIANLIKLERKFLQTSSDAVFLVSPIVNFKVVYQPLIEELYARGFNRWDEIKSVLKPLDIKEISMNKMWLQMFADGTRALKFSYIAESSLDKNSFYQEYQARLKYKENMTLNDLFSHTQLQLINENLDKSELAEEIKIVSERSELAYEQIKKDMDNLIWISIKNYRNVVGTLLRLTATPRILNLYEDKISMDLRILLLNALIQSQDKPIQDIVNSPEFINPYTGRELSIGENKICYQIDEPICINREM